MTEAGDGKRFERVISAAVLALLMIGCLVVVWPFVPAMLWAVVLAFTTWPVYRRVLFAMKGKRTLAALGMTLIVAAVLLLPLIIAGTTMADDVKRATQAARAWFERGPAVPPAWFAKIPIFGAALQTYWQEAFGEAGFEAMRQWIEPVSEWALRGGIGIGRGLLQLTLSILVAFFVYRDGEGFAENVKAGTMRIAGERGERLLTLAGNTVRGVVYGILGTAIAQAVVAGIGFAIAGVPGAAVLALLTFVLGILPFGPPLIWIPVALWLFYKGSVGWAVFMLIWGCIVSSLDNFVKPWLISMGSNMPFILTFFGVIGGALAFGFIGVFLGPTLLALGYAVLKEWMTPAPSDADLSVTTNLPVEGSA
jgi:predicted PurR-regulated permease PerM